jgi:queuine/archaeosine tRNA-ribosyltransferase
MLRGVYKMNKIHYVPAGLDQIMKDDKIDLIQYLETEYFLTNYLCFKNKNVEEWRNAISVLKKHGKKMMMDSGGFQLIADPKLKINPKDVFSYQSELADMGFILDVPLLKLADSGGIVPIVERSIVEERLEKTIRNVNDIKDLDRKESELFLILHGNTPKEYHEWYNKTKGLVKYDGISLKTEKIHQFVISFFTIYKEGFTKFHALGTSAVDIIPIFFYVFSKINFDRVTYDSSNALQFSVLKRMIFEVIYLKNKTIHITQTNIKKSCCNCKMCKHLNYDMNEYKGIPYNKGGKDDNLMLTIHNCNVMNRYNDFIQMLAEDPEVLKTWCCERFPKLKVWFEIVDKCFELCDNSDEDFYKIYDEKLKRYHQYFNFKEEDKQQNVMSFF